MKGCLLSFAFFITISYACDSAEDNVRNQPIHVPTIEQLLSSSKELSENIKDVTSSLNLDKKGETQHKCLLSDLESNNLSSIHHSLGKLLVTFAKVPNKTTNLSKIQDNLIILRDDISSRPLKMFQNKCLYYFSSHFGNRFEGIEFIGKPSGRQLGNKLIIKLSDDKEIVYYSKTHGKGLGSESSKSSAKPVNPKELFMYKYLESTNLGQEVHFFYDDVCNFYIATKGACYNEEMKKIEEFKTYTQIRLQLEEFKNDFEEKDEEKISHIISNGLIKSDIISRIFRLSDLVSNDGNIGFTYIDGEIQSFKIIDFDVNDNVNYNNPEVYQGFLSGNGVHNYAFSPDSVMRYYLFKRDIQKRIKTAKEIIKNEDILRDDLVDQSYSFVYEFLRGANLDLPESAFKDLEYYTSSIKKNLRSFLNQLKDTKDLEAV
jgi:hypothetical protein